MATAQTTKTPIAARTGEQFLDGLRGDAREIWLNGEKITHPLERPHEVLVIHRFEQVGVGAQVVGSVDIRFLIR